MSQEDYTKHAGYMRERYATNTDFRIARINTERLTQLRRRGGLDEDTLTMLPFLQCDPCAYCGQRTIPFDRTQPNGAALDHIDPVGGSHWTNLTGSCRSCNAKKRDVPLMLSMLERRLRLDVAPIAEQIWLIRGRQSQRRRIDY